MSVRCFVLLLCTLFALGQNPPDPKSCAAAHYPTVIRAEVPLYPAAAHSAHLSGTVEIEVTVEKGAVTDAKVKLGTVQSEVPAHKGAVETNQARFLPYLSLPSLANIKTWQFHPEYGGTFVVKYVYRIEGEQTSLPENPKVELDLPCLVTVTAKPFKPSCSGCLAEKSGGGGSGDQRQTGSENNPVGCPILSRFSKGRRRHCPRLVSQPKGASECRNQFLSAHLGSRLRSK